MTRRPIRTPGPKAPDMTGAVEHWLGPTDASVPTLVGIYGPTAESVTAAVGNLQARYPEDRHGTFPGPVVQSVTNLFRCSVVLIPADGGDLSRWDLDAASINERRKALAC